MGRIIISILLIFISFQSHSQIAMFHAHNQASACTALGIDSIPQGFYSFRLLNTCYVGQCVRIRRSNDNAEQDFGFVSGFVDTASIKSFVGANDGFVVTWYNQGNAGSAFDMSNATAASQPSLVLSGALNYADGRLATSFDGTDDVLFSDATLVTDRPFSFLSVSKRTGAGEFITASHGHTSTVNYHALANHNTFEIRSFYYTGGTATLGTATTNTKFESTFWSSSTIVAYNGVTESSTATTGPITVIRMAIGGGARGGFVYRQGKLVEVVAYSYDQYVNRSALATNIKTYYGL